MSLFVFACGSVAKEGSKLTQTLVLFFLGWRSGDLGEGAGVWGGASFYIRGAWGCWALMFFLVGDLLASAFENNIHQLHQSINT